MWSAEQARWQRGGSAPLCWRVFVRGCLPDGRAAGAAGGGGGDAGDSSSQALVRERGMVFTLEGDRASAAPPRPARIDGVVQSVFFDLHQLGESATEPFLLPFSAVDVTVREGDSGAACVLQAGRTAYEQEQLPVAITLAFTDSCHRAPVQLLYTVDLSVPRAAMVHTVALPKASQPRNLGQYEVGARAMALDAMDRLGVPAQARGGAKQQQPRGARTCTR